MRGQTPRLPRRFDYDVVPLFKEVASRTFAIIFSHPDAGKTNYITEKVLLFDRRDSDRRWPVKAVAPAAMQNLTRWRWKNSGISYHHLGDAKVPVSRPSGEPADTPGHEDFRRYLYRTLTAVDQAV